MGSAASTASNQVHDLKATNVQKKLNKEELIKSNNVGVEDDATADEVTTKPRGETSSDLETHEHLTSITNKNCDDHVVKITNLELELANVYSRNLDQEDQIQSLKELINEIQSERETSSATEKYNDTVRNNEKQISQLEKEIDLLNSDSQKLKLKYKRKIKLLTSKLTEAKHIAQIQRIEMSTEIKQLTELNRKSENTICETSQNTDSSVNNDRTNLVVELSAQFSEQTQIISDLETELLNKQKEIDTLKLHVEQKLHNDDPVINSTIESCWANSPSHMPVNNNKSTRKKTYKLGQHRSLQNNKQLALVKTVKISSSDSDSDWANDIVTSKIHSAPAGIRTELTC